MACSCKNCNNDICACTGQDCSGCECRCHHESASKENVLWNGFSNLEHNNV